MKKIFAILLALASPLLIFAGTSAREARLQKLNSRPRRVIWNNDGCDINRITKTPTPEALMQVRNAGLVGKKVDVLSYCTITSGLGMTTSSTKIGEDMSDVPEIGSTVKAFQDLQTDALKETVKFAHDHGMEAFWSLRMNDCHDAFPSGASLMPKKKKLHPELLIGSPENHPPYAYWSAYDYTKSEVRDWVRDMIVEVMENYEVDGVEFDFCRHWALFRSAAYGQTPSQEECDALTKMMKEVREAADRIGMKRSRPILVSVRVMDSVPACRAMGIELEKWCHDNLVDIVCGGSEVRLNHADYWAKVAQKYPNVHFYMTTTDAQLSGQGTLLKRNYSKLNFRAQAAAAYAAGLHGIYSYNEYNPGQPYADYLREFSDPAGLAKLNKCYYFSHSYSRAGLFGKRWDQFQGMPSVTPQNPLPLGRVAKTLELYLGEEASGAKAKLILDIRPVAQASTSVTFNGEKLNNPVILDDLTIFEVPGTLLKKGMNEVAITINDETPHETILKGDKLLVYGQNQGLWRRLFGREGWFVPSKSEKIENDSYVLSDVSEAGFSNLARPLYTSPDGAIELAFEAKFVTGNDPDATLIRLANGQFAERLQLTKAGIAFKYAQQSAAVTSDQFHQYRLTMQKNTLTLFIDGQKKLEAPMTTPYTVDADEILNASVEPAEWLAANSLIAGSLSQRGTGNVLYRNMTLKSDALVAMLYDGALLVIHDADADDLPPRLKAPLLEKKPATSPDLQFVLTDATEKEWGRSNTGPSNFEVKENKLFLNSENNGPVLTHIIPSRAELYEIELTGCALRANESKSQLQILVVADDPKDQKRSLLWGYRLGYSELRFLDDAPAQGCRNGDWQIRILYEPKTQRADLYVGTSCQPLLQNAALSIPRSPAQVSVGDGTAAVMGICEIKVLTVKAYSVAPPLAALPDKPVSEWNLNAQNYKTWTGKSFNATNLVVQNGLLVLDNRKIGPILEKPLTLPNHGKMLVELEIRPTESDCPKSQLQFTVVTESGKPEKSALVCYRFGKDGVRFVDDPIKQVSANPDGWQKYQLLIDLTSGASELYLSGGALPLIARAPILLKKTPCVIGVGDGSSAVIGICEIKNITVKIFE